MKCSECKKSYRVGAGLAYRRGKNGALECVRLCRECDKRTIKVLVQSAAVLTQCACGDLASVCEGCVKKREKSEVEKALRASEKVTRRFSLKDDAK